MKRLPLAFALLLVASCRSGEPSAEPTPTTSAAPDPPADPQTARFGAPFTEAQPLPLRKVLENPEAYANKTVTVEGTVRRNCTRKGCWMELAEDMDRAAQGCRVTFKDYAFFVPLDSAGSSATVRGTVATQRVSASEVEHLESEGATFASKLPDGSAHEIRIVATGVSLSRSPS